MTLDLDIITNILPMENLGLTMNRCCLRLFGGLFHWSRMDQLLSNGFFLIVFIIRRYHVIQDVATTEKKHLASGLGSLNFICR